MTRLRITTVLRTGVIFVLLAAGCSTGSSGFQREGTFPGTAQIEVETIEQQAMDAVMSAPTTFEVPASESSVAWSRARLFFERYTGAYRIQASQNKSGGEQLTLSNSCASKDSYEYRVSRRQQRSGSQFVILCTARDRSLESFSNQNARNLARFIRDGQLELSLLKR